MYEDLLTLDWAYFPGWWNARLPITSHQMLRHDWDFKPTPLPSVSLTWRSCQFWVPFLHVLTFMKEMKKRWSFKEFVSKRVIGLAWTLPSIAERASPGFSRAIVHINTSNHLTSTHQHRFGRLLSCSLTKEILRQQARVISCLAAPLELAPGLRLLDDLMGMRPSAPCSIQWVPCVGQRIGENLEGEKPGLGLRPMQVQVKAWGILPEWCCWPPGSPGTELRLKNFWGRHSKARGPLRCLCLGQRAALVEYWQDSFSFFFFFLF